MDLQEARHRLEEIEQSLDAGTYRRGRWQRFLREASGLERAGRETLVDDVSRVGRKLHARNEFVTIPFALGLAVEVVVFVLALIALAQPGAGTRFLGVILLTLCLQPLIKLMVGILLGVRYDYAYLWYIEPRFKMQYGTYFRLDRPARVGVHLAGAVGTPLAMLAGYLTFAAGPALLSWLFLLLFIAATALQVGAFAAEWAGMRMVGPFRLSNLTSPATAAMELKASRDEDK